VDSIIFGLQESDVSQGRYPDGNFGGVFYSMQLPTPNSANTLNAGNQYAPVLAAITDKIVNEGLLLTFACTATDADAPAQTLSFSLDVTAPLGASINSSSGVFSWTPLEDQGPGVYPITVKVTDNASPAKTDTKTFNVTVNEVNLPPTLANFPPQTVDEGTLLQVQASGSDSDIPGQALTYSLAGTPPANVTIDASTGVLSWTPTEAQGPATNLLLVKVTDNGTPSLSATGLLSVVVREVNTAPVLSSIADRVISVGTLLSITNSASDSDLPANLLSYSLEPGFPGGAGITSPGGVLTWTPAQNQSPSTNSITVRVSDDGAPALSATRTFQVIVVNQPKITEITRAENGSITLRWESFAGLHYRIQYKANLEDADWSTLGGAESLSATGNDTSFTYTPAEVVTQRFFRLMQVE
jgi:hypothetical protein